jgi:hypothetical protein
MRFGNLSARDRWVRMVLGACMLAAAWLLPSGIGRLALEIFGWPPLAAAAVGWDPIYAVFGIDTARRGERRRELGRDGGAAPQPAPAPGVKGSME